MTHRIPLPRVLDPDRLGAEITEGDDGCDRLEEALRESRGYARQLWQGLDASRRYLVRRLPEPGLLDGRIAASPAGLDDDEGWQRWMAAFAQISSLLAGPNGDQGVGRRRAADEATARRTAPVLHLAAAHPQTMAELAARQAGAASPPAGREAQHAVERPRWWMAVLTVVVVAGLRGSRGRRSGRSA
jgi:hypothetical protein